ncbi:hypothetical protein V3H18_06885 [Methylocystis sp. 9N]|uniref:Uncharacterized protein n=1 Tax=Methylocystis borbori TaxID=3118750 RepID=A0ABU7XFU6_9HYPH
MKPSERVGKKSPVDPRAALLDTISAMVAAPVPTRTGLTIGRAEIRLFWLSLDV